MKIDMLPSHSQPRKWKSARFLSKHCLHLNLGIWRKLTTLENNDNQQLVLELKSQLWLHFSYEVRRCSQPWLWIFASFPAPLSLHSEFRRFLGCSTFWLWFEVPNYTKMWESTSPQKNKHSKMYSQPQIICKIPALQSFENEKWRVSLLLLALKMLFLSLFLSLTFLCSESSSKHKVWCNFATRSWNEISVLCSFLLQGTLQVLYFKIEKPHFPQVFSGRTVIWL